MTAQKKVSPAKMVIMIATEKFFPLKSGLDSSAHLPTDSKPDINHGTTCQTSRMEIRGEWLNTGRRLLDVPCFTPSRANPTTRTRKVNVVAFKNCALA